MRGAAVLANCLAAALVLSAGAARADRAAADACASGLDAPGRAIYATALPEVAGGADLRGTVRSATVGLVRSGAVPRSGAEAAAQAAGRCLAML